MGELKMRNSILILLLAVAASGCFPKSRMLITTYTEDPDNCTTSDFLPKVDRASMYLHTAGAVYGLLAVIHCAANCNGGGDFSNNREFIIPLNLFGAAGFTAAAYASYKSARFGEAHTRECRYHLNKKRDLQNENR